VYSLGAHTLAVLFDRSTKEEVRDACLSHVSREAGEYRTDCSYHISTDVRGTGVEKHALESRCTSCLLCSLDAHLQEVGSKPFLAPILAPVPASGCIHLSLQKMTITRLTERTGCSEPSPFPLRPLLEVGPYLSHQLPWEESKAQYNYQRARREAQLVRIRSAQRFERLQMLCPLKAISTIPLLTLDE
jgi:hypothetical protein